jgi:hypothetical protein
MPPWPPDDVADDHFERALGFRRDVADELRRLKIRKAAQDALRAETEPPAKPFDAGSLREILARPPEPPMRAEGLVPSDADTLIVSQRKTGKTTLVVNYADTLITGCDFLGRIPVRPIDGNVAMLNFEVSAAMMARWAHEHGVPRDRLFLVNLRGRRNPLAHPEDRERLAKWLRSHDTEALMVDPFGRAYTGKSQNDPGEVGAWLVDLDVFARSEVGARDLVLSTHAGWNGERTRGSSALEDWADSIITMTRDDEDHRYLRATGRDVDLDEDRLDFDPATRTLTLAGVGSRKQDRDARRLDDLMAAAVEQVQAAPGINGSALGQALRDAGVSFQKGDERKAARQAVDAGRLRFEEGPRGAKLYFTTDLPRPTPTYPDGALPYPDPSCIGGVGGGVFQEVDLPRTDSTPEGDDTGESCADCGEPISWQRAAYGKTTCCRCGAAS